MKKKIGQGIVILFDPLGHLHDFVLLVFIQQRLLVLCNVLLY